MLCKRSENCIYYNTYRYKSPSKQSILLVQSYCEGQLQSVCRRKQYEESFSKAAPENLAPNGYIVGSHKKLKVENTRKHKRYEVRNGKCLLQELSSDKTFFAEVLDVSKGGLKLVTEGEPQTLENGSEPTLLKIIRHTLSESPVPLTKDFIKIVWQRNQVLGCEFSAHIA